MASTVELWTPPAGMSGKVTAEWRAFYRRALDLYGVTPDRYLALYLAQKGRCWICRTATGKHPEDPKGRGGRRLGIDHNHTSGFVRGLLCTGGDKTCNRIIGWLTAPALHRAADYLDGTCTPGLIVGKYGDDALEEAVLWPRETDAPVVSAPANHKGNYGAAGMDTGILPDAHRCADCSFVTASAERMDGHMRATGHAHESEHRNSGYVAP
jgi:hypothetical protein